MAFHAAVLGVLPVDPMAALHAGLALIVLIECVIAGRVVPAFTMSATPGLRLAPRPRLEQATLAASALALALWVFAPRRAGRCRWPSRPPRRCTWRASGNGGPGSRGGVRSCGSCMPAYAWIPVGFGLLALAQMGWVARSAGVHALAVGATGGLIIGMITRTARGHTGRPLTASTAEVAAYVLVMAAAALRVIVPLVAPRLVACRR